MNMVRVCAFFIRKSCAASIERQGNIAQLLILNVYEQKVLLELADLYVGRNAEYWFRLM